MKLLVLDGNSILNRAFYGIKLLTTKDGTYTNGIYGFLTMMQKLKEETSPDAVAVAFDMRAPTFRHKEYAGYKAQRKGMPPELAEQMPILKELLTLLGYKLVECEGYEADDILGTLAESCKATGDECVIATGDRDSLQLVSPHVTVRIAATKFGRPEVTVYDEAKIKEDYGIEPKQLIEVKALQGDSSDNIPGVAGIGPKGACELIQKYGNIDEIYEHIMELDIKESMRQKLVNGKENAFMSRNLGTICTEAPVDKNPKSYVPSHPDSKAASRLMAKLEFFSLISKMGLDTADNAAPADAEPTETDSLAFVTASDLPALLSEIEEQGRAVFTAQYAEMVKSLFLAIGEHIYYVTAEQPGFAEFLRGLFENEGVAKITHDSKPLFAALDRIGINFKNLRLDTLLAGYLLNPSASGYDISRMAAEFGVAVPEVAGAPEALKAAAQQAGALPALAERLSLEVDKNSQTSLLRDIEIPLARVLADMETVGFAVDRQGIEDYGKQLEGKIAELQESIYEAVGYTFNINSPKQLGEALFEKLGLQKGKKTKSGYSTNAEVLENLRYEHPAVERILEYRTLAKLKSTYCDGLLKVIAEDGRIHSNFNQTETRTGRISSTEPNLQNIPVRTDVGRELRRFFVAQEGHVLVDADYSQIELRVLAHVANDSSMIEAFRNEEDIHRITASQVFHMPFEMVTPLMRSRAKAVNFGIVYGIGAFSLSKDISVTRSEADHYIKDYLAHYAGVDHYMKQVVEQAKEQGYVETMFGRRRYLPELASSNFNLRAFGERVARNMPIQGAAADIIKIAMIRVSERLRREGLSSRLILQVHDELIVEAPENEAQIAASILTEEMEGAARLAVPLTAEASTGKTWYDAKG